jgi:hypothetical protein
MQDATANYILHHMLDVLLYLHSPGSETNAPVVALSPCVSVVPSAHDSVTGEASGRDRTAIP